MEKALVLDANSILHRAFHALPPLSTKKGKIVNAIYGFLLVFFKAVKEFQPDFVFACFDFPGATFRHKEYNEYKATRPPTPKDLVCQIKNLKEILNAFEIPVLEKEGYEADDLIGTVVRLAKKEGIESIILTGDSDILQLVQEKTRVYFLKTGVKTSLYDENSVKEKYGGLSAKEIVDFKALLGDPSDNVPGVKGIGEKTAIELIKEFGSLEDLYKEIEKDTEIARKIKPKTKEILLKYKNQALFSKKLIKIREDTPIDFDLKKCRWKEYEKEKVVKILKELEFKSLIERLPELKKQAAVRKNLKLW